MSLSKRKELADIKVQNAKLSEQCTAHYNKLKTAAVESAKSDFRKFFTEQEFSIQNPSKQSYSANPPTLITASYQNLSARFEHDPENPAHITMLSNIKGYGDLEYFISIHVKNPKATGSPTSSYMVAQDEAKRLEQELQRAQKDLEYSELAMTGLVEAKASFFLSSQKSARNPGNNIVYNRELDDFSSVLKYLFD